MFSNSPPPEVAIYCLQTTALQAENTYDMDVKQFIMRNFSVDDGHTLFTADEEAPAFLKASKILAKSNIRQHKIASNNLRVKMIPLNFTMQLGTHVEPAVSHLHLPCVTGWKAIQQKGHPLNCQQPSWSSGICSTYNDTGQGLSQQNVHWPMWIEFFYTKKLS